MTTSERGSETAVPGPNRTKRADGDDEVEVEDEAEEQDQGHEHGRNEEVHTSRGERQARRARALPLEGAAEPVLRAADVDDPGHRRLRDPYDQEGDADHRVSRTAHLLANRRQAL